MIDRQATDAKLAPQVIAGRHSGQHLYRSERVIRDQPAKLVGQDLSGAIVLYQKALTLKPGKRILAGLYRSMGIAFTRQGNMEESAHYYRLYLPLCSNLSERTQLQKVLEDYDARRR